MRQGSIGKVLGNWELVRLLGEGGFGAVYEARHRAIAGRGAAVKVLHPHLAVDEELRRRFLNEASAASRAEHENIVQIFDCGDTPDGLTYVIMELLRGHRLSEQLQKGPLGAPRTLHLGVQVASALGAAHRAGIVHRDLKPDNLFLVARETDPEFVKVLDFGIAKLWDAGSRTTTGTWMGTPPYMSPEQWQTLPDIDGRSDIYALGVILYQCLTGVLPLEGKTPYEWLQAHLHTPPADPRTSAAVPDDLAALVLHMLAKDRADRPADMAEVQRRLKDCRGDVITGPAPVTPPAAVVPPTLLSPPPIPSTLGQGTGQAAPVPHRPRRWLPAAALVAAGLAIVLGTAWRLKSRQQPHDMPGQAAVRPPPPPPAEAPRLPPAPPLPAELVVLGPGRFLMGAGDARRPEGPAHQAEVGRFALGRYEVSQAEFREFAEKTLLPGPFPWDGIDDFASIAGLPANLVTRAQAEGYCRWRYPRLHGRLPTEAEWEFAAAGAVPGAANAGGKPGQLVPVRSRPEGATPQGVHHLLGNVAEWTAGAATAYPGGRPLPAGRAVARGGGARTAARDLRITARQLLPPSTTDPYLGFRCAADAPAAP